MENEIDKEQEMILALVESKSYDSLTNEEQLIVKKHLSKEEYSLQRIILMESKEIGDAIVPLPLNASKKKMGIVIPLYQAVAGIAAAVLFSFFVFRTDTTIEIPGEDIIIAQTDTIYVDKVVVDTIVEYRTQYVERVLQQDAAAVSANTNSNNSPMFGSSTAELPDLSTFDLSNRGTSAINDETFNLLDGVRF